MGTVTHIFSLSHFKALKSDCRQLAEFAETSVPSTLMAQFLVSVGEVPFGYV